MDCNSFSDPWTLTLPLRPNQHRCRHIPKQRHKVTNWRAYHASLRWRSGLVVWSTDEAIEDGGSKAATPWEWSIAQPFQTSGGTLTEIPSDALESVQQLADTWRTIVMDYGPSDTRDLPGMAIRWADSKFQFWNAVTFTDQGADSRLLDERLAQAAAYMRQKSQPGLIWLFEDLLGPACRSGLPAAADRAGLSLSMSGFGMAGDILPIPEPTHPNLRLIRVTTEDDLQAYADLNSRAYGMPLEAGRDGLCGSELWRSGMYAYLGLEDGVPVSAAAAVQTNNCLFLALVATAPEAQCKGYGEATSRKALFEGAKATGLTRSVLHATMAGAPVYERIGYRKVAMIGFYGLRE